MQEISYVRTNQLKELNEKLSDGWVVASVNPIAQHITGEHYNTGEIGAFVVIESIRKLG